MKAIQEVGLTASEVYPEISFPLQEILNNLSEFASYLQNLKETLHFLDKRSEAHIYLTNESLEDDEDPKVRGDGDILAILRINFMGDDTEYAAQETKEGLFRAKVDIEETALRFNPGLYDLSYPSHFLMAFQN